MIKVIIYLCFHWVGTTGEKIPIVPITHLFDMRNCCNCLLVLRHTFYRIDYRQIEINKKSFISDQEIHNYVSSKRILRLVM